MAINPNTFVTLLADKKYTHICAVPCSFVKYLINAAINSNEIEYIPAASEAVACSIAAGLKASGAKPIVIAQSSGLANMGSCITSLLKPYQIQFPILVSWRSYKPGDSEIQHEQLSTSLPDLITSYGYGYELLAKESPEKALLQLDTAFKESKILIIQKETFESTELNHEHQLDLSCYLPRSRFLLAINKRFCETQTLFIGTTGNTAREMYQFMPNTCNFYMAGNMGGALSLGLGAALNKRDVVVCGGDAEFVMHMGGLTTAARYKNNINLTYILFDNQQNKSTGGQNTYQQHVDYSKIALGCGFQNVSAKIEKPDDLLAELNNASGLNFIWVRCGLDPDVQRPPLKIVAQNEFS